MESIGFLIKTETNSTAHRASNFLLTPYRTAFGKIVTLNSESLDFDVQKVSRATQVAFGLLAIFSTLPGLIAYAISRFSRISQETEKLHEYYSIRQASAPWLATQSQDCDQLAVKRAIKTALDEGSETLSLQNMNIESIPNVPHRFFTERLRNLDLSHNNVRTFDEMPQTRWQRLDLTSNHIESLSSASNFTWMDANGDHHVVLKDNAQVNSEMIDRALEEATQAGNRFLSFTYDRPVSPPASEESERQKRSLQQEKDNSSPPLALAARMQQLRGHAAAVGRQALEAGATLSSMAANAWGSVPSFLPFSGGGLSSSTSEGSTEARTSLSVIPTIDA